MNFNDATYHTHGPRVFHFAGIMAKAEFSHAVTRILLDTCTALDWVELDTKAAIRSISRAEGLDFLEYRHCGYIKTGWLASYKNTNAGVPTIFSARAVTCNLFDNLFGAGLFK